MLSLARLAAVAAASLFLVPLTSHAQLFRTYVSVNGVDTNPCTVSQPCRLLPAALTAVADGGEVWILDSANFNVGTVTITKSVSITSVPGQMGIRSSLNGVTVRGASAGIANTRFHDIDEWAVLAESTTGNTSKAAVSDSQFDDVAGAMKAHASSVGDTATVSAIRCSITNSSNGVASVVDAQGSVARMTIGSSLVSGVGGVPFLQSGSGATTETLGDNISVNNAASSGTISTRSHF